MNVLAIYTNFKHHGEFGGYKQILKFIKPKFTLGIFSGYGNSNFLGRYPWLYEFIAWYKYRKKVDLIHLLYGEDYFRFSSILFPNKKIVVSFHQPENVLRNDVKFGNYRGRVGALTHKFTKNRFKKLHAAIVMEASQKNALATVMPSEKIHVLPLGTYLNRLDKIKPIDNLEIKHQIITVGVWERNWDEYFSVVEKCNLVYPNLKFILITRILPTEVKSRLGDFSNLEYLSDINDIELYKNYYCSIAQFLPVHSAAGNNTVLEGFSLGCPLIMTNVVSQEYPFRKSFTQFYDKGDVDRVIEILGKHVSISAEEISKNKKQIIDYAQQFSWESIARKTIEIYEKS